MMPVVILPTSTLAAATVRRGDRLLIVARDAHRERTGHARVYAYGNFVECEECKMHAHLGNVWMPKPLNEHDRIFRVNKDIEPEDF